MFLPNDSIKRPHNALNLLDKLYFYYFQSGSHIGILLNKALDKTLTQDMSSNVCKKQYGFLK